MITQLLQTMPEAVEVIEIMGRIDAQGEAVVQQAVEEALAHRRTRLVLDLHGVDYINSAGLRALVGTFKRVSDLGGALVLINPTENVQRLLELVGLDSVLTIHYDARWDHELASGPDRAAPHRHICYCL